MEHIPAGRFVRNTSALHFLKIEISAILSCLSFSSRTQSGPTSMKSVIMKVCYIKNLYESSFCRAFFNRLKYMSSDAQELMHLEEDERALEEVYPQGEKVRNFDTYAG